MKQLFLSFSVADDMDGRHFVRQLFDRLRQQPIDPWVFESPRGQIETGGSITDACRRKIEQADIFVVFITDQALKSAYVDMEVAHALWDSHRRILPIVPLIATGKRICEWPPAMAEVTDFKGIPLPPRPIDALEAVVIMVCGRLDIEYAPPKPTTPRLPLRQRLAEELQARKSQTPYDAGDFGTLLQKCDLTVAALDAHESGRARRLLDWVLVEIELQYGVTKSYYPRIVYGAVLMMEAYAGRASFADVERHFSTLIDERGDRLDANAFAGRANALVALGRFDDALTDYYAAESHLEGPDSALFYNIVRAQVLGGLAMDRVEIQRRRSALSNGIVTRAPGDLARLMSSVSLAYAYVGDADAALDVWREVGDMTSVFPELVIDVCHQLQRHAIERRLPSVLDAASAVISEYIARRADLSAAALFALQHLQARLMFDRGDHNAARAQLAALIERFPGSPIAHIDAAMFALADGDVASARRLCQAVATLRDQSSCNPALSSREFNLVLGHAFWLLGQQTEARESFRRSEYTSQYWYASTMPDQFGAACWPDNRNAGGNRHSDRGKEWSDQRSR